MTNKSLENIIYQLEGLSKIERVREYIYNIEPSICGHSCVGRGYDPFFDKNKIASYYNCTVEELIHCPPFDIMPKLLYERIFKECESEYYHITNEFYAEEKFKKFKAYRSQSAEAFREAYVNSIQRYKHLIFVLNIDNNDDIVRGRSENAIEYLYLKKFLLPYLENKIDLSFLSLTKPIHINLSNKKSEILFDTLIAKGFISSSTNKDCFLYAIGKLNFILEFKKIKWEISKESFVELFTPYCKEITSKKNSEIIGELFLDRKGKKMGSLKTPAKDKRSGNWGIISDIHNILSQ